MRSLRGIWESETRKQNGHYQSAGPYTPPEFEMITIPAGGKIFSFENRDDGVFTFGAPGYVPVDASVLLDTSTYEDYAGNQWTLEDWGDHDYRPDTGVFTVCRDNDSGYGPRWYWWYKVSDDGTTRTLQDINLGTGQISGIVRDWLCPTFHNYVLKCTNPSQIPGRAELDALFGAHRVLMNGPKYKKNIYTGIASYYAGTINNVPSLTGAQTPGDFKATYIAPPLPSPWRYYNNNTDCVHACATEFLHFDGQIYQIDASIPDHFFQARQSGSYYYDVIGGTTYIWASVMKKLLIKQYPMTN